MNSADAGPSTNSKARVPPTPANLRFQRRTSERAFYEGALREGTMEYPGSGTSPWASSPEASRTSFGDVSREHLPEPTIQEQHEGEAGGSGSGMNGEERPEQVSSHSAQGGSWSPEQQHQWQQHQQEQQQGQTQARGPGEENRRPQSARYHGVPPQQRHMPQYKLQAKITGMERSQKKDPIIRFDVYVCLLDVSRPLLSHAYLLLDQSTQIQDYSIPRYTPNTLRIPEARITSDSI